jgi:hypothetical protein
MLTVVHLEYRPVDYANAENRYISRMKNFPVVLFQCEMWSPTAREQQELHVFQRKL